MAKEFPHCVFVTKRYCEISQEADWPPWYSPWWECVVVDQERHDDIIPSSNAWDASLMTDAPRHIHVSRAMADALVSGEPLDIRREKRRQFIRSLATNSLELSLEIGFDQVPSEVFLLADREAKTIRYEVEVDLPCHTLAQLPDFRAQLDRMSEQEVEYDSIDRPLWKRIERESQTDLWREAAATTPASGCYFPMEIRSRQDIVPGILALNEQRGTWFKARVFLSDARITVSPGTELYRVARWRTRGTIERAELHLATIRNLD
jgi:hypothetical protein